MADLEHDLSELKGKLDLILERQSNIQNQLNKVDKIVVGNGKIEEGVLFRLAGVENHVKFVNRFGWLILSGAMTIPPAILTVIILNILQIKGL